MFSDVIKWDFLGALTLVYRRRIFNSGAFLAVLFFAFFSLYSDFLRLLADVSLRFFQVVIDVL